jgi:hypothetical protein
MRHTRALQLATLALLDHGLKDLSVQGFGMLRFYIRDVGRVHIWDSRLRYPGVSLIHTHAWDLRSTVVSGRIINQRFREGVIGERFHKKTIVTGYNTRNASPIESVYLLREPREIYLAGETYQQAGHEIHQTEPNDSTITIMERSDAGPDHTADVYWPAGTEWGNAQPRRVALDEVAQVLEDARAQLLREIRA